MGEEREVIRVGMAESKVARNPGILMTCGLGSCVGVSLYDPVAKVGGMAHVMLPDSTQARHSENAAKFADTAIPQILDMLTGLGAVKQRLVVKIAGGAQMFSFRNGDARFAIGARNVEAVEKALASQRIPIVARDTGGNFGRTIILDTATGAVTVKTIGHGEFTL